MAGAGFAIVGMAGEAASVSFGKDDRVAVSRQPGAAFDTVGLLIHKARNGSTAAGAATLVSPCHVLSAYHVAGGGDAISADTTATFYLGVGDIGPGFDDFDHFALRSRARAVVWGDYVLPPALEGSPVPTDLDQDNGWEDWALMRLDTCLGDSEYGHGYMRLMALGTRALMRSGASLAAKSLGFPIDKSSRELWLDPACSILGQLYSSGWQHDCITLPGNSGGPIIARDEASGEDQLVAINVSHIGIEGVANDRSDRLFLGADDPTYYEYLSIGVPVAAFAEKIAGFLPPDQNLSQFAGSPDEDYYQEGSESEAIADLDAALRRRPGDGNLLLLRGLWHASMGDVAAAFADWRQAQDERRMKPRALYQQARLMLEIGETGQLAEAENIFASLMQAFPRNPELRRYRGLTRARRDDLTGAIEDFSAVLRERPESAVTLNDRGDAYRLARDYDRALSDYDKAIALAPEWPEAWRDRGYLEHVRGRYERAEHDFRRALSINAGDAEALNGLGLIALSTGDGKSAIDAFGQAIEARPESGVYFANRGAASWIAGDLAGAIADFTRSISLDPLEPYIRLFEYLALARIGERAEAAKRLRGFLDKEMGVEWPRPLMEYYLGLGSIEAIESALHAAPRDKRMGFIFDRDFYLGQWALLRGDRTAAIRRLQAVLDSGLREYLEFDLARADLQRLGAPSKQ